MTDIKDHVRFRLRPQDIAKEYWHIDQSQGNVHTLPWMMDTGQVVNALGSTGCRTCVCVFVELSQTTCFAAHISAIDHVADITASRRRPVTAEQRTRDNRARIVPDQSKGQKLVEIVVEGLCNNALLSNRVAGGRFNGKVERALVVCPMKIWGGERGTGSFIIEALEQFFGVRMECEPGHGFIAAPGANQWSLQIVRWRDGYPGPSGNETDFYDSKKLEGTVEEEGWTRMNPCKEPQLDGLWAFAYTKSGSWVHFFDRD